MRNWFKDQCTTRFTVMLWVKRSAANGGRVGIVHNGDCVDPPTFLIYGDEGGAGNEVLSGLDTDGFPLTFSESVPVSILANRKRPLLTKTCVTFALSCVCIYRYTGCSEIIFPVLNVH